MSLYKLTVFTNQGEKKTDEFKDEDAGRNEIDSCLNNVESHKIKGFSYFHINENSQGKTPWWEK